MWDARLYLVAPARLQAGRLADMVDELAAGGVDVIQLREKELEPKQVLEAGAPIAEACRRAGIPFVINDRPDIALALRADGLHLGQDDIPPEIARAIVPGIVLGGSTHSPEQVDQAAREDWDYFAVGPVFETPTKPGRPGTGLELIRHAAGTATSSVWFAIGGIDASNLADVMEAGARRVVVVRAITEAPDPPKAAAELKQRLR
ncbi:MAG: thiamine phosphate synthase [Actinobacteria bacterium]|nr:thiamine phosphate synthase [Actinomycetota bacterium]